MSFIKPDGVIFNVSVGTFSAFNCLARSEQLPERLGPGQQFVGSIVVDAPRSTAP